MDIILSKEACEQPPVRDLSSNKLTVAISSLSLGGAERIVLDWASRVYPSWNVHIIVLRDKIHEWSVPPFISLTRLHGKDFVKQLYILGKKIAKTGNGVCVCHMLTQKERLALAEGGAVTIPVLHNAKDGWPEDTEKLLGAPNVIAVSNACARDLQESGWEGSISVIRHIPRKRDRELDAREFYRRAWNIPQDVVVIGMIGGIKEQKNYFLALRILKAFLEKRNAYLVIIGGPVAKRGEVLWKELVDEINRLDLRSRVALPGSIPDAARCLSVFDVMLNTSRFEGLSIATLEALISRLPVVATHVGGQGEIAHEGLTLMPLDASETEWVLALEKSLTSKPPMPSWADFPAHRQWTLANIARPFTPNPRAIFITANLSSGGAQRSLVNLAKAIRGAIPFSILVTGFSTTPHFYRELKSAGITVERAGDVWNAFSFAESIVDKVVSERICAVCFWNVDARVKLLSVKALAHTNARFIDVSPGDSIFGEMGATQKFQQLISFSAEEYYQRLDRFVMKFDGQSPTECSNKTVVIPNGVPLPKRFKNNYAINGAPQIAVNGRIAPEKFIIEIVSAMRILWKTMPTAELHIFGGAEPYYTEYAHEVTEAAGADREKRIFFHGLDFNAKERLWEYDAYIVLGKNQGCPNALLEALAAGLPSIGNNDGGTCEQLINGKTGLLINSCDPSELAQALRKILQDRVFAEQIGKNGREHVTSSFSMKTIAKHYIALFNGALSEKQSIFEKIMCMLKN